MAQAARLIATLKSALRMRGMTYADVARALNLSEASIKRCFARGTFTLDRLERICALIDLQISDLVELDNEAKPTFTSLTPEQEVALLQDDKLLLITFLVLNRWRFEDIVKAHRISEHEAIRLLSRLDRLGMIDLLPGNRIRLRTAHNFSWRKDGPVQRFFEREVLPDFLASRFAGPREDLKFAGGLLSRRSLEAFRQGIERLAREFNELVEADAALPLKERFSCGALLAIRPWVFSHFARLERSGTPAEPDKV
ncbi:MAG TPA: helix-turn-helix transcriptional regulator [Gammaproteobacteria bacterium]|nr:helix-turn-helix transcriptional regulator [Gammaproteobacteria bacterium]